MTEDQRSIREAVILLIMEMYGPDPKAIAAAIVRITSPSA